MPSDVEYDNTFLNLLPLCFLPTVLAKKNKNKNQKPQGPQTKQLLSFYPKKFRTPVSSLLNCS